MAVPHKSRHGANRYSDDGRQAQTKTLGVLVAVMVVAGVVALIMTLVGGNSTKDAAAGEPSGSQVGNQTSATAGAPTGAAASSSSPTSAAPTTATPTAAPTPTTAPATSAAPTPKPAGSASTAAKIVKYTVKKGDNLTLIAKWFNQRGYGSLYDWNKSVIGRNPNLIFAGQTIIVSLNGDHMKVSTGSK